MKGVAGGSKPAVLAPRRRRASADILLLLLPLAAGEQNEVGVNGYRSEHKCLTRAHKLVLASKPASMHRRPRVMPRRQPHVLDPQAVARYRALQPTVGENLSGHDRHVGRLLAVGRYKV